MNVELFATPIGQTRALGDDEFPSIQNETLPSLPPHVGRSDTWHSPTSVRGSSGRSALILDTSRTPPLHGAWSDGRRCIPSQKQILAVLLGT